MITAQSVGFSYGEKPVLQGVDLAAGRGQVVGLIGPNGSGKTTLLRTLYASLTPESGEINLDGASLRSLSTRRIARQVAVVVQESDGDLPLPVADLVLLGRLPHRKAFSRNTDEDYAIADGALRRVGAEHLADRQFAELSGGERQRVLIARALTQQPTHLLLDEPTNHLDIRYQHEILGLVAGLEATVVVVLHDLNLAAAYCDSVVLLSGGRVVASGPPDAVLTPEILEPVYEVAVQRLDLDGRLHLAFRSRSSERVLLKG